MGRSKRCKPQESPANEQPEDFRIEIDRLIRDFLSNTGDCEIQFPTALSNAQRKYIHERCRKFGIKSRSKGKEPNRVLCIFKKATAQTEYLDVSLSKPTLDAISDLVSQNPATLQVGDANDILKSYVQKDSSFGLLNFAMTLHVDAPSFSPLADFRKTLPVYSYREPFLELLEKNQVIIISAETGSGKTTQIPQYILESCCAQRKKCRIICTQPRRISTVTVAERVSHERGEQTGHTVGYQIKLESKVGLKTSLIYCTTGILLRTLMNGDECCNHLTHIIVDEIHERDKFTDFVLVCLKQCIVRYPHLRLILMSATLDSGLFSNYFDNHVSTMFIPGRTYPVTEFFLDEILAMVNYQTKAMKNASIIKETASKLQVQSAFHALPDVGAQGDEELLSEMNAVLLEAMRAGTEDYFAHIMQLILCDSVPVNYADVSHGYSPIIVAAAHGNVEVVEQLINLGADIQQPSKDGRTPIQWADYCGQTEVVKLLNACRLQSTMVEQKQLDLLSIYDKTVYEDTLDFDLILAVIVYIHKNIDKRGGILVFLPGYEHIINCHDRISNSNLNMKEICVCILHGSMQISAQHEVFKKTPNKQKIILSTNVAETSITIDGVRFVVDTGKAKQKTYDSISGTSALQTTWISMAGVKQRAGRAGRTQAGICFHLFSKVRYNSFLVSTTPEILRVPLHELCLQTKMLAPQGTSIAQFLALSIEPPPSTSISKAVSALVSLGALDKQENLTPLGMHLLQLSVEPHLGKMLIYSTIFKCLDPVLTIVASLAHKDPFVLPVSVAQRSVANAKKKSFSFDSLSDHMTLLVAFQQWQEAKIRHRERQFCAENFISMAAMQMIMLMRSQLLGQLRAAGFVPVHRQESMREVNENSETWPLVKAVLAAGLFPNVAFYMAGKLSSVTEKKLFMHGSSCLRQGLSGCQSNDQSKSLWMVFQEMSRAGAMCSLRGGTAVTPATVLFACGSSTAFESSGHLLKIDDTLVCRVNGIHVWTFRNLLDNLIQRKIVNSRMRLSKLDEIIVETLIRVLSAEDTAYGLVHPAGIGGRPKLSYKPSLEYKGTKRQYNTTNGDNQNSHQFCQFDKCHNNSIPSGSQPFEPARSFCPKEARQTDSYQNTSQKVPYYQRYGYGETSSSQHAGYLEAGPSRQFPSDPAANSLVNVVAPKNFTFPHKSRFFFIRPMKLKNILISVSQGTWRFSPQTERKLFKFFNDGYFIVLLFTIRGTNIIQGVANLLNTNQGVPNRPCPIEWLGTNSITYDKVKSILHPKIHITEDGQEASPQIGLQLSTMLMANPQNMNSQLRPILGSF